jgi:hypothetical protein
MDLIDLTRAERQTRLSATIVTVILMVATLVAVIAQGASASASSSHAFRWHDGTKPVIVLEHGAWADASSWDNVIRRLQDDGFTVYTQPNPPRCLPQDSAYLVGCQSCVHDPQLPG